MDEIQSALDQVNKMERGRSSLDELVEREVLIKGQEVLDIANVINRLNEFLKSPIPGLRGKSIDEIMDNELKEELNQVAKIVLPNVIKRLKKKVSLTSACTGHPRCGATGDAYVR